jgi:hypothetical protein
MFEICLNCNDMMILQSCHAVSDIMSMSCSARSFMKTIKERLTEGGASGAFFFFTKDERFIAKSCTTDEIAHIRRSAVSMAKYLEDNPFSFITKVI